MTMIRKTLIAAACLIAAGAAHAQLGGLGSMLGSSKSASASGDLATDVAAFVSKSGALSAMAGSSVSAINAAFSSDQEIAAKRAQIQSINQITNTKEKDAKMAALFEDQRTEAKRRFDSGEMEKQIGGLDATKKKMIGNALLNFGIGSLQAVELTRTGQALLQQAGANPMNIGKIMPVKDALPLLGKVVSDSGGFLVGVAKLAKGANISVQVVKADSKPVETTF